MNIKLENIISVLREQDIEGLIAAGAPIDEYDDEAQHVYEAITSVESDTMSEEALLDILSVLWAKSFELDADELALRSEELKQAAQKITA